MTATRSRKENLEYSAYLKTVDRDKCVFCSIKKGSEQLVEITRYFKVINNIFAYSVWDGQSVKDHLMVTPKKHTDSLTKMSDAQKIEYVDLIQKYESAGYNIYARAPSSAIKSVIHQHTHLIKTAGAQKKFVLLLRKPYFRLIR